jgi:hypothetical protein
MAADLRERETESDESCIVLQRTAQIQDVRGFARRVSLRRGEIKLAHVVHEGFASPVRASTFRGDA